MKITAIVLSALLLFGTTRLGHALQMGVIPVDAWSAYKARFLDPSGRIVDNANGNISHSEGQGYGLLLAYLAGNPADFEQIWYFTRTELLIRDDGLAAWRWDPATYPHVTDPNNASDGDLLIAYALALAGATWKRNDYIVAATGIAHALLSEAVVETGGRTVLLPAVHGYSSTDRDDGPVINPSYWIYEALPVMAALVPSGAWKKLADDGVSLLHAMRFGPKRLPADWVSLRREPRPATGFDATYGYDAVRIPLFLLRGGIGDRPMLSGLQSATATDDGGTATFDLSTGETQTVLQDAGYQIVNNVVACVLNGKKLPASSLQFAPVFYYPSSLQLLGLAYVGEKHPECL